MDEREVQLREQDLRQREFAERFGSALETWRFEVNSYWTRSSYFALFQAGAFAGLWKIFSDRHWFSSIVFSVLGCLLTVVWILNNMRMHEYVEQWWIRAGEIEEEFEVSAKRRLVHDYDKRRRTAHWWRYSWLNKSVPILFLVGWIWMLGWSVCTTCHYLRVTCCRG